MLKEGPHLSKVSRPLPLEASHLPKRVKILTKGVKHLTKGTHPFRF